MHHVIACDVYKNAAPMDVVYAGNLAVGEFMRRKVFDPGGKATRADLSPDAFVQDFEEE